MAMKRLSGSTNDIKPSPRTSHEEGTESRSSDGTALTTNQQITNGSNGKPFLSHFHLLIIYAVHASLTINAAIIRTPIASSVNVLWIF
nr:unnamed protein product [Haemonchus contortus]